MKNQEFKIGDTVANWEFGKGVGEITEITESGYYVVWHDWSIADCIMKANDLIHEPIGGF
jgi:hypothetical protein